MLSEYKKKIAVFMILVIVFSFFNFVVVAPKEVKAAELPYYCVQGKANPETGSRDYCFSGPQEKIEPLCDGSVSLGNLEDDPRCQPRTCVPADGGVCLSNVPEIKCQSEGGLAFAHPKENVPACQLGCCNRGGVSSVMEQTECPTAADGGFTPGITDQLECSQSSLPPVRGCCEMQGECSYSTADTCDLSDPNVVNFHDDRYCSEVSSCSVLAETHSYLGCGNQEGGFQEEGSQHNVYWYDSDGNREELVPDGVSYKPGETYGSGACGYPDYVCEDPDGPGGEADAFCRSTSCILEGDCPDCDIQEFLNGDTICLNIHDGHFINEGRSTAIREYVLACNAGIVEPTEGQPNRGESVCIDGGPQTFGNITRQRAKLIPNNWEQCDACGDDAGAWADAFSYIPYLGTLIAGKIGNACEEENAWDYVGTGGWGEECRNLGKVGDIEMCYYDHDLYAPMGSCNPINPPSTTDKCGECGNGGDAFTNVCTIEECNMLGDCYFENEHLDWNAMYQAGLLAAGTATALVTVWWAACSWIPGLCSAPSYWTTLGSLLIPGGWTSAIYWIGFSTLVGVGASLTNLDPEYEFAFKNDDGTIDLAWMLAMSNSVPKILQGSGISWTDHIGSSESRDIFMAMAGGITAGLGGEALFQYVGSLALERALKGAMEEILGKGTTVSTNALGRQLINKGFEETVARAAAEGASSGGVGAVGSIGAGAEAGVEAAGQTVVSGWGQVMVTSLQVIGAMISVYTTAQSLNPGECYAENAYTNSDHCSQCGGAEGQWFCTKERCNVLGGGTDSFNDPLHCRFLKTNGPSDGACVARDITDSTLAVIEKIKVDLYDPDGNYIRSETQDSNTLEINEEFGWYDLNSIKINIETDDRANCKYTTLTQQEYTTMNPFGDMNFPYANSANVSLQDYKDLGDIRVYMKCEDINGNIHTASDDFNYVEIHFAERPDEEPPEITLVSPHLGIGGLPESTSEIDWIISAKENKGMAGCRYTQNNASAYEQMEYQFNELGEVSCVGANYQCTEYGKNLVLSEYDSIGPDNITESGYNSITYNFYMSCMDGSGNFNNPAIPFGFSIVPTFEMNITAPLEEEYLYEADPFIEVKTGSLTICDYEMDGVKYNFSDDDIGYDNVHSIQHPDLLRGSPSGMSHTLSVTCEDQAFNSVTEESTFYIVQDVESPRLVSIYDKNNKLFIVLNEEASCNYTAEGIEETEMINSVNTFKHQLNLDPGIFTYHITCMDIWENDLSFTVYI